jgi:hypothetical protein
MLKTAPAETAFKRNQHDHITFTIVGKNLTGISEFNLLRQQFDINFSARQIFTGFSSRVDSYDARHRLPEGKVFGIALVSGEEIPKDSERKTENLLELGKQYGYGEPLGGMVPRIREFVIDEQMEEWGIETITVLHRPITVDGTSDPYVLRISCGKGNDRLVVGYFVPAFGRIWEKRDTFAFPFDL